VQDSHRGIEITSRSTGTVSGVKRKSPEEGRRTLSFQISGDGKCFAQKKAMKEKAILFGEAIMSRTMWRGKIGMAYNAFYIPATTLTKKDCEEIQKPVVNFFLPNMGIARSAPKAVIFGTAQFGGLGLTHLAAVEAHACDYPTQCSHVVEVCERTRYIEIANKYQINVIQMDVIEHVIEYTSGIRETCHTLPRHIHRLFGNIPELDVRHGMNVAVDQDIIVATDGSAVFRARYHSWVVATDKEQVLLTGGGPDDGDKLLMTSYRSELGGIASGLAVIGTLVRSEKIKVKTVKFVCDNEGTIKACKRKRTQSVFHRT
jgi:hypothetical protein